MRCRDVQRKLDLFATEELAPWQAARIEAHLETCLECRQGLIRLGRLRSLLAASPSPPIPEGFVTRLLARAGEREAAAPPARLVWKRVRFAAATAAALAAGLLVGLFLGHDTWISSAQQPRIAASQSAELLAASGFDGLVEPGGDSLTQAYLELITPARQHAGSRPSGRL